MIPRELLPENIADWCEVSVSFPQLPPETPESLRRLEDDAFLYVQLESADLHEAQRSRLCFVRSAEVAELKYWLWEYKEVDGEICYVTLRLDPDQSSTLSMDFTHGLNHEQFLLADYYGGR